MDPYERIIQIWHDSVVEYAQALESFIHNLPLERALFWKFDLWFFLEHWRDRGIRTDPESYQRLRVMLDGFRDQLIAEGVETLPTYTPSAEQTAW